MIDLVGIVVWRAELDQRLIEGRDGDHRRVGAASIDEAGDTFATQLAQRNLLISGPTGIGKSWLGCALGHKACRDGRSVIYHRVPRLFEALALARGDGRHARMLKAIARIDLLILDDWGLSVLNHNQRIELLEILEDRSGRGSTLVTSQVPVEQWHEVIGDNPTLGDAILDRLIHNAHRLAMTGESMRKIAGKRSLDASRNP